MKAETPANTRAVSSEPLPTNVSEESESSSQPGEARCVYLSKERRIPVFPFQCCDLILLPPLGEPKPEVVGAEMSAKVSVGVDVYTFRQLLFWWFDLLAKWPLSETHNHCSLLARPLFWLTPFGV